MAKVRVVIDRFAFHPLMKTGGMQEVLESAAQDLQRAAGSDYEIIRENQNRRTRNVISVGDTAPNALRREASSGTLARALSSLEKPWKR